MDLQARIAEALGNIGTPVTIKELMERGNIGRHPDYVQCALDAMERAGRVATQKVKKNTYYTHIDSSPTSAPPSTTKGVVFRMFDEGHSKWDVARTTGLTLRTINKYLVLYNDKKKTAGGVKSLKKKTVSHETPTKQEFSTLPRPQDQLLIETKQANQKENAMSNKPHEGAAAAGAASDDLNPAVMELQNIRAKFESPVIEDLSAKLEWLNAMADLCRMSGASHSVDMAAAIRADLEAVTG